MVYTVDQRNEKLFQKGIRLWNPSVGYIYKLYAHSNRFNDFSELIVYVYAHNVIKTHSIKESEKELWDEHQTSRLHRWFLGKTRETVDKLVESPLACDSFTSWTHPI